MGEAAVTAATTATAAVDADLCSYESQAHETELLGSEVDYEKGGE